MGLCRNDHPGYLQQKVLPHVVQKGQWWRLTRGKFQTLLPPLLFLARFCALLSLLTCPLPSQHELQHMAEYLQIYSTLLYN